MVRYIQVPATGDIYKQERERLIERIKEIDKANYDALCVVKHCSHKDNPNHEHRCQYYGGTGIGYDECWSTHNVLVKVKPMSKKMKHTLETIRKELEDSGYSYREANEKVSTIRKALEE